MKTKLFSITLLLILTTTFSVFAQFETDESNMFGSERGLKLNFYTLKMEKTNLKTISKEYLIKNTDETAILISDIIIPDGFGVTVLSQKAEKNENLKLSISAHKNILGKGKYNKTIIIKTSQEDQTGAIVTKKIPLKVSGIFE